MKDQYIFQKINGEVSVFVMRKYGGADCVTFYTDKKIGQCALSNEQLQEDLKKYQRSHDQITESDDTFPFWLMKAQIWFADGDSRREATAKGLVKILGPLQDKGIIGPDKCNIL